MLDIYTKA